MRHANVAFFVPHLGCPHQCSFCDQRKISGTVSVPGPDEVKKVCEKARQQLKDRDFPAEIAFFGGSFTAIDPALMRALLEAAYPFVADGSFDGIRLSTRPDAVSPGILKLLKNYGVTTVELGAQSMDDAVLSQNGRGHTADQTVRAAALIREAGLSLGLQMMVGLPGEKPEGHRQTAEKIALLRPGCVRIYPALVVEGTDLARRYREGKYMPLTVEEAVEKTAFLLRFFEDRGIAVIRVGLHAQQALEKSCIAGPYHPAFGELCYSRVWLERLLSRLEEDGFSQKALTVLVHPAVLSQAIGQKRENLRRLSRAGYRVRILSDNSVPKEEPFFIKEVKDCI